MTDRAQSEVVGVVLLIGVVVTLVGIVSVVVLSNVATEQAPVADLRVEGDDTHLTVTHQGGDGIPAEDLAVVVREGDRTTRFAIDAANLTGDENGRFEFGESLVREHGHEGADARILVVHRPTSEVLAEATVRFESGG